jgi:hypothetical protein
MARDEAFREAEQRIEEARQSRAKTLYLDGSSNDESLTALPESLGQLTELQELDQMVKEGGQWRIAHRRVRTDRLVADPHKPVNLADPDVAALVGHLLEAAQRLGQKVD